MQMRLAYAHTLVRYGYPELVDGLGRSGIVAGDTLLMHSRFTPLNGFTGSPHDVIRAVRDVLGERGTLAMMSQPYRGSSREYLSTDPLFDCCLTPSHMGIVSEVFRRSPGVRRSLSPTHPVIAAGANADGLIADHEQCRWPCGDGSPFEKMHKADAKILFFDLRFVGFTFFHYLEHRMRERLPYALYDQGVVSTRVRSGPAQPVRVIQVNVLAADPHKKDRVRRFVGELRRRGVTAEHRVGGTFLGVVSMRDCVRLTHELFAHGQTF